MFRKTLLALAAIVGAASAQKTSTFSVCSASYDVTSDTASYTGSADLYTCNGGLPVGSYSFICSVATTSDGQNNLSECINTWIINGCTITQIGQWDSNNNPLNPGTWLTTKAPGVKKCPKATSFTGLAYSYLPGLAGDEVYDKYTFSAKGGVKSFPV